MVASRRSSDSSVRALLLTVDHVIGSNQDEALRLSQVLLFKNGFYNLIYAFKGNVILQLGLDIGSAFCSLGTHGYTR